MARDEGAGGLWNGGAHPLMPHRPRGPDPPHHSGDPWTSADVELWLKAAFRAMPYTPIFAPRGNTLKTCHEDMPDATFDIVAFTGTVLGDKSDERLALLFWARVNATRGEMGSSVSEFCRLQGWKRPTFEKMRRRASARVAAAKNTIDCRYVAAA